MQRCPPDARATPEAFTLVELLAVVAVIITLMALVLPAGVAVLQGRGVEAAMDQVAAAADLARSQALASNTYVWLGLGNRVVDGENELVMGIVRSRDGTPRLDSANAEPVANPVRIRRMYLAALNELSTGMRQKVYDVRAQSAASAVTTPLQDQNGDAAFSIGDIEFDHGVLFAPTGEAMAAAPVSAVAPFTTHFLLGVLPARGAQPAIQEANSGAILLYGGTGQQRRLRP